MIEDSQHAREGTHRSGPDGMDGATDGTRCDIARTVAQDAPDMLSASAVDAPSQTANDPTDPENGPCVGAGEGGRALMEESAPPRSCPCSSPLPCPSPVFRRGVCRTVYRKLSEAGLPIGDDRRDQANASRGLAQLAHRLSSASPERTEEIARRLRPDARDRLRDALDRAAGGNGKGER